MSVIYLCIIIHHIGVHGGGVVVPLLSSLSPPSRCRLPSLPRTLQAGARSGGDGGVTPSHSIIVVADPLPVSSSSPVVVDAGGGSGTPCAW
jgi:hypothetical protein